MAVVGIVVALLVVSVWRYQTVRARQLSVLRELQGQRVRIGMERFIGKSIREPYEVAGTVTAVEPGIVRVGNVASSDLSGDQRSSIERQGLPLGELIWVEDAGGRRIEFGRGLGGIRQSLTE